MHTAPSSLPASAPSLRPPTAAEVDAFELLLADGRDLDALANARAFVPFEAWGAPRAVALAAYLCGQLGAPSRSRALALRVIRHWPASIEGRIARLGLAAEMRGPLEASRRLVIGELLAACATDDDRVDAWLFEAQVAAGLRDFERAGRALDAASAIGARARSVSCVRARVAIRDDRYADAFRAAEEARAIRPCSPEANNLVAHLHVLRGDATAAIALLRVAAARTQSASLALHLAMLLGERGLHDERSVWIEEHAARTPLREDDDALVCMRSDCAYDRGDIDQALALARVAKAPFHASVAASLAARAPDAKRVVLDVPFVRQHHLTCAPATLSALASFWGRPVVHVTVAEAICYDGTPHHHQRAWAEANGFVARELTVTWDAVRALLDRGVPITVGTVQAASAHLQALVGYDELRATLLIRDPFVPHTIEALATAWLAEWHATGPYGMAIVPAAEAARLEELILPDAALYDRLHAVNTALERHDRPAAEEACAALVAAAPEHRLAIASRRALAAYDQDAERVLACARETMAKVPAFIPAQLDALACLRAVGRRDERIAWLEELMPTDPIFAEVLGRELAADAREHGRAARLLRRAIRARPDRHVAVGLLASLFWAQRRFDEALEVHRAAACLGRLDEEAATAYFVAARALGRQDEALAFLTRREADLGGKNAGPVASLCGALDQMDRGADAARVLDAAVARRGDDGELLLFAAGVRAELGEIDAARALLARVEGRCRTVDALRAAAAIALHAGDFGARRALLERIVADDPLDAKAHHALAASLSAAEGPEAGRAYLADAWSRAPHCLAIARAYVDALRAAGPAAIEAGALRVLEVEPTDAWTRRELALALGGQGRLDEAHVALDVAARIAPSDASIALARGRLHLRARRVAEARAAFAEALVLDADRPDVIEALVRTSTDPAARQEALAQVEEAVARRSVSGAGITAWYMVARPLRPAAALRHAVDRLRTERAAVAATWSCAIRHRIFMGAAQEALVLAREATERFPLVGGLWGDRADAASEVGEASDAIDALERAARIDAHDEWAASRLAMAYVHRGEASRARQVLERAIGRLPASSTLRLALAERDWREGARDEALARVRTVLAFEPDHPHAWERLDAWSAEGDAADAALALVEQLERERPWSAHASLQVARAKGQRNDLEGALAKLGRATALDPMLVEAHDLRAIALVAQEKWKEAEAACAPAAYGGEPPRELRGRAAWVRARRGDVAGAVEVFRAILADHPDFTWGWLQLADLCRARGAIADYVAAARSAVAAAPDAPATHAALADARLATGDREGAKRTLARSLDRAPGYEPAAKLLFELCLEDDEEDAAARAIALLGATPAAANASVRWHARRGDRERTMQAMRSLTADPRAEGVLLASGRRACIEGGFGDECDALFTALVGEPTPRIEAWAIWIRTRGARGEWAQVAQRMRTVDLESPSAQRAASEWISALRNRNETFAARDAARDLRRRLKTCEDGLWADIGLSLWGAGQYTEAAAWLHDWKQRKEVGSGALFALAISLRETGRYEDAFDVVRVGAARPRDGQTASHCVWLAFELAMRGETRDARRSLGAAGPLQGEYLLKIATLVEAVLSVQEATPGGRLAGFARARAGLRSVHAAQVDRGVSSVLVRAEGRARRRVARDVGLPLGPLWLHGETVAIMAAVAAMVGIVVLFFAVGGADSGASIGTPLPLIGVSFWLIRYVFRKPSR